MICYSYFKEEIFLPKGNLNMKTISQVAKLTGVSIRTLQYYDEIGLLPHSELTEAGYRLYDDNALQTLQQILFFKELGFQLKEISEILKKSDYDRILIFKKQKELFLLKRNRIDRLIQLLERLERGEHCMSFKEFDLSDYVEALENFKLSNADEIVKYWGSVDNFNMFIQKVTNDESYIAKAAIQEFGSIEKYTEAMKQNMEHFSEFMEQWYAQIPEEMLRTDLFTKLASLKDEDVASKEVQNAVRRIVDFAYENATMDCVGSTDNYCKTIIGTYSNDYLKAILDAKNGSGYCDFIVKAFRYYLDNMAPENE